MRDKGFLPFTAVGIILLILAMSIVGYYRWSEHRSRVSTIEDVSDSSLVATVLGKQSGIELKARESLYEALWSVGKEAYLYEKGYHENLIEELAGAGLKKKLQYSSVQKGSGFILPKLNSGSGDFEFDLERSLSGYPKARVSLPEGTSVTGRLIDSSLSIAVPFESFETSVDARFFLLRDRMNEFSEGFEEIGERWKYAEYAMAYAQAWAGGEIHLSKRRSRLLFQLALASHEIDKFGSTDYRAIVEDLASLSSADKVIRSYDSDMVVRPIRKSEIECLVSRVDSSLLRIEESVECLRIVVSEVGEVNRFDPRRWFEDKTEAFSDLARGLESSSALCLKRGFQEICENFEKIYRFPGNQVKKAHREIEQAIQSIIDVREQFRLLLGSMEALSEQNPMMEQLYEDFSRGESLRV